MQNILNIRKKYTTLQNQCGGVCPPPPLLPLRTGDNDIVIRQNKEIEILNGKECNECNLCFTAGTILNDTIYIKKK